MPPAVTLAFHMVCYFGGSCNVDPWGVTDRDVDKLNKEKNNVIALRSKPAIDSSEPAPTSQPLVLSIDNERPILQLYERYLKNHGYQVYGLTDPTKAVDLAHKLHPVAITLDVMMPGCDGWQVLEDLKANHDTRSIPVIICSILEDQGKASSLGASNYLTKPILEDDLIQALTRLNGSIQTKINPES